MNSIMSAIGGSASGGKKVLVFVVAMLATTQVAFAAPSLGSLNGTIGLGKNLSVDLGTSATGQWFVVKNTNSSVASANLFGNKLVVNGLQAGSSSVSVCSETSATNCMDVVVTVSGSVLGTNTSAHAPGSWVLYGKTVFYVHSTGLIPISTWEIFINNGGTSGAIIPANDGDLNLPLLPLMTLNDSRVAK